jgi:hypothetical protein
MLFCAVKKGQGRNLHDKIIQHKKKKMKKTNEENY